jgi:hypothetical protein
MIIVSLSGGLGNQMFQYAAGKALATRLGATLKIDTSFYQIYNTNRVYELDSAFSGSFDIASQSDLRNVLGWLFFVYKHPYLRKLAKRLVLSRTWVVEKGFAYNPTFWNSPRCCVLEGNWQSEKYFADYQMEIRSNFSFDSTGYSNQDLLAKISETNSIGIHIRRGDYVTNKKAFAFHGVCVAEYYSAAIKLIQQRVGEGKYFVFSDDITSAKSIMDRCDDVTYVDNHLLGDHFDMMLMSKCKHNIIANSSFSWWGAWLNTNPDKIVIAPKKWFANGMAVNDLLPDIWLKI